MAHTGIGYVVEDRVGTITLSRVEVKNALNQAALDALVEAILTARSDEAVWVIELRADGSDFCTGQDIKELVEHGNRGDFFYPVYQAMKGSFKPVVCVARGLCLGGGAGIVMSSDIRIISATTRMGWPHAKLGLCSISAPTVLARAVPVNIALELMFTGDLIDAHRIIHLGLANHVVPDTELEAFAQQIRNKLLANAPLAVRAAKEATMRARDLPYKEAAKSTRKILDRLMNSRDAQEGMRAFLEKRRPSWRAE